MNTLLAPFEALGTLWAAWMVSMAVQVTLLAAAVWLIDLLIARRTWPGLRYALWCLVPLKLMLPPHIGSPVSVSAPAVDAIAPTLDAASTSASGSAGLGALAMFVWLIGAVFLATRHLVRRNRIVRALRSAEPASARVAAVLLDAAQSVGLRRVPRVVLHPAVQGPAVFGLLRPTILLPAHYGDVDSATRDELAHVLMHECAHVRRGDLWAQAIFGLLNLVYWFHPLVFVARRRAHALREVCCDLTVACCLEGEAPAYRLTLLRAAERLLIAPAVGAGFVPGGSMILARVRALEVEDWYRPGWRRAGAAALVMILAVTVLPMAHQVALALTPTPTLEQELDEARAVLATTINEKPHYGCFQRQAAFFRVLTLEERLAAKTQAPESPTHRRSP